MHPATELTDAAVLTRLEAYYDAVPRANARVEDFDSVTLFVGTDRGSSYYGRPTLGRGDQVDADAINAVLARQQELGLPRSFEWVEQTTPGMGEAALAAGLVLRRHPLLILDSSAAPAPAPTPESAEVWLLDADDPALASAIAAAQLAFSAAGTDAGSIGRAALADRTAQIRADGWLVALADRMRAGRVVVAAAADRGHSPVDRMALCSGQHNPIDQTTEIVGIGTLPSERRRGLAQAVTTALVNDARARGIDLIFLSAGDDDVARIYTRIGFRRIGTAISAEPAG